MAKVQVVKQLDQIKRMRRLLFLTYGQQMADLWDIGINTGLKPSDLLNIKYCNIKEGRLFNLAGNPNNKRPQVIVLNNKTLSIIKRMRMENIDHIYLFQSHRWVGAKNHSPRPISQRFVSRSISAIGKELGLNLAMSSMRKTRGYFLYMVTGDLNRVIRDLNYKGPATQVVDYIEAGGEYKERTSMDLTL